MTGKLSRPVLRGPTPGNGGRLLGGIVSLIRARYDASVSIIQGEFVQPANGHKT